MTFIFQQDVASRRTKQYLEDAAPEFINDEWTPQSPDCNLMDYCVWNSPSEKVYERSNG